MSESLNVLVVDDNPQDRHLVKRELDKAFPGSTIVEVIDQAELDDSLGQSTFDIVITDYHLHWTNGIRVLRSVKESHPLCPVIMFTGTGNEEVAVEAMKHGLDDYIIKNVRHLIRLRGAIKSAVENAKTRVRAQFLATRLESLLSQLRLGVFSCDPEGNFRDVNDAMTELLESANASGADASNLKAIFPDPQIGVDFLHTINQTSERVEWELERDQKFFRVTAKRTPHGSTQQMIDGLVEDITERRAAQNKTQQSAVASAQIEMLSPRERQVFLEVVDGKPNKSIARHLKISEKTVEKHRSNLMRKLQVYSVAELVRLAMVAESNVAG